MKLTNRNYYSTKANNEFMSVSQFKSFKKCEAMTLAELNGEYERPKSKALLLGSFVDEMLTGTKKSQVKFIVENFENIFQKSSRYIKIPERDRLDFVREEWCDLFKAENGKPYAEIVKIAEDYIRQIGGFEKLAEWGLY